VAEERDALRRAAAHSATDTAPRASVAPDGSGPRPGDAPPARGPFTMSIGAWPSSACIRVVDKGRNPGGQKPSEFGFLH